ncbi:MAG: PD40 domain-containing protein [Armatimonadetes bacterium]|nr:PD40 domain-containing protein [Armatimonadota bacterium]
MLAALAAAAVLAGPDSFAGWPASTKIKADPREKHLANVRQITFGGQNAEAYWNVAGTKLIWQSMQPEYVDEQVYTMTATGKNRKLISTGLGRCTCAYYSPDGKWLYFSSTHELDPGKQPPVDMSKGYVWMINPSYRLYRKPAAGGKIQKILDLPGYVAETTIDPKGRYMVFTSDFEGDLEIYRCDLDGKHIKKLTSAKGYDGGPFVSWDGKLIAYRRTKPFKDAAEEAEYDELLKAHLVRPTKMDIWVMNADGTNKHQVTNLPGASFAPFILPGNKKILFSTNFTDPRSAEFDVYMSNLDGSQLEQITYAKGFDGFPMVTKDGKKIVFASNRNAKAPRETNVFVADWKK